MAQNCHDKTKNLTGNTKYLTAKLKTSRQKQNTSQQNQKPHSETKDLTAKTKYLTAKANTHGKTKAILPLLWSTWFCYEVFCFCREVFGFAVMFLFLLWQLWATIFQRYKIPTRKTLKVVKKSSEISNCLFSVTMSVLLWELHEKFLQFDWIRAVAFQLNLKYLHVKITNLLLAVV